MQMPCGFALERVFFRSGRLDRFAAVDFLSRKAHIYKDLQVQNHVLRDGIDVAVAPGVLLCINVLARRPQPTPIWGKASGWPLRSSKPTASEPMGVRPAFETAPVAEIQSVLQKERPSTLASLHQPGSRVRPFFWGIRPSRLVGGKTLRVESLGNLGWSSAGLHRSHVQPDTRGVEDGTRGGSGAARARKTRTQ